MKLSPSFTRNCLLTGALALLSFTGNLPADDSSHTGPRLIITSPRDGQVFTAPAAFQVEATGLGVLGGITDAELWLDGEQVAESHIRFIREPGPDEPVSHVFDLKGIGVGSHTLSARSSVDTNIVSSPVTIVVSQGPTDPPETPKESLRILTPAADTLFSPEDTISVEAVAVGRYGGITRLELLVDGSRAGVSEIVFIRAPEANEPVYHHFELEVTPPVGPHRLSVRDIDNPELESESVPISVVVTSQPAPAPLLRLTSLSDGVLMLVLAAEEQSTDVDIQVSSDLVHWESISISKPALRTPVAATSSLSAGPTTRFYRALSTRR